MARLSHQTTPVEALSAALDADEILARELQFKVNRRKGAAGLAINMVQIPAVGLDIYNSARGVVKCLPTTKGARENPSVFLDFHDPKSKIGASWKTAVIGTDYYMPLVYPADSNSVTVDATRQEWRPDEIATAIMQRFKNSLRPDETDPEDAFRVGYQQQLRDSVARLGLEQFLLPPELT